MREVTWWRVLLAFFATMAILYLLAFTVVSSTGPSVAWILVFTIVANAVWWGILLLPSRRTAPKLNPR